MVQRNRRERRASNRQPKYAAVLLAVVALFSFGIGFMAGRTTAPQVTAAVASPVTPQPITAQRPDPSSAVVEEKVEDQKLTFYDALPKGEQPPMGSGINVPPEQNDPVAEVIDQQTAKVSPAPAPPAPVKAVAKPAPAPKPTAKVSASASAPHVLQVAAFKKPTEAGRLVLELEKKDYEPYIQQVDLGSKGIWYRVFLGPYATKDKARTAAIRLKAETKREALVRKK